MIPSKDKEINRTDLTKDQKQQKIYQQLTQLDLKLKSKSSHRQIISIKNPWDSNEIAETQDLNNFGNGISQAVIATCNPHMEFFSQISNQQFDEDSLFVYHNNFLGQLKHAQSDPSPSSHPINKNQGEMSQEINQEECSFGIKNSKNQFDLQDYSHFLKQRNYVYKQQMQRPSNSIRSSFIQKTNKEPHHKKFSLLQKSRQKLKEQLDAQLKQNMRRKQSNQKYNLKNNFIEEQVKNEQTELNKFSTFQSFFSKAIEANNNQKNRKQTKSSKEENSLQCTFKPTVLKKSSQMAMSTKNIVQRLSTLNLKQKKPYVPQPAKPLANKQRIQELSQPRRLKTQGNQPIQQIPSFRPSLSKKSLQQMANCVYDVATRNQLWLQQKKQKLKRIKEQQELQRSKRQSCTYSPALCPYKGNNDPSFSRFGKQGIANHFERLSVVNKNQTKSKGEENLQNKQNRQFLLNQPKINYVSKGKKPNYQQAVKQLHNRIMNLNI